MHSILVKDYLDRNPHAINQNAQVRTVIATLLEARISGAPVVDDENNLVGFVSEQDCIKVMLNDAFYCQESPAVSSVMSKTVVRVSPQTSILEVAEIMSTNTPKIYPVEENGKLVGLITRRLILKALLENNEDCYIHHG